MSVTGPVAEFALGLADLFEPLLDRLATPEELEYLFSRYGWRVELDETAFAALSEGLAAKEALQEFLEVAGPLRRQLAEGATSLSPDDVAALAHALDAAIQAVSGFSAASLGGLPAPLDAEEFWTDIGEHLLDDLLEEYLRFYHPGIYVVLLSAGVVRYEPTTPEGEHRRPYRRILVDWSQAGRLAEDPSGTLKRLYRWGSESEPLDHVLLVDVLDRALRALRVATDRQIPGIDVAPLPPSSPYRVEAGADGLRTTFAHGLFAGDGAVFEIGLQLLIAARAADDLPTGVVLSPVVRGSTEGAVSLGGLELKWKTAVSAGELLGVAVFPDTIELAGGEAALDASIELTDPSTTPRYLFGSERTARLEVNRPSLRLSIEGHASDPETRLQLRAGGDAGSPGARFVVPLDDADAFIKKSVPTNALDLKFNPEIIWSSRTGLTFNGQPTLNVDIPIATTFAGVRIHDLHMALRRSGQGNGERPVLELEASTSLDVRLGPVLAKIDRLGLRIGFDFAGTSKNVGFADLSFGIKPPSGIGIAVDTKAVSGGGSIFHDPATGTYFGVLALRIGRRFTLTAFGLVATKNADGTPGSSFIIIGALEGLGWQLGPVTIDGLGLLVARDRTFDENAMRAALPTGQLKHLLFPTDPVHHTTEIMQALQTFFPAQEGRTLVGLLVKLFLFKQLMRLDLAFIFEWYPGDQVPDRLIVLGRLSSVLPTDDVRVVQLNLDAVGLFDFSGGTIALDAVLVDSKLIGRFPLTGAAAFRRVPGVRGFALAVGGFHPRFTPPPGFPAVPRVTVALTTGDNPKLILQGYVALTANTLQFGADAALYAAACGFSIEGNVGFDVLIQFYPPHFKAEFRASVQLKRGSTNLFKVAVEGLLEGPFPLRVAGTATFEILWWDVTVSFDKTLIKGDDIQPELPAVDAESEVVAALEDPRNWTAELPDTAALMVALRRDDRPDQILVHPMGTLQAQQGVAPLNLTLDIDRLGEARVTGARRFHIKSVGFGGDSPTRRPVRNEFARGQLFDMTDDERLAAPSFEQMEAGVAFGGDSYAFAPSAVARSPFDYEDIAFDAEGNPVEEPERLPVDSPLVLTLAGLGAAARATFRDAATRFASAPAPDAPVLRPVGYAVASANGTSTPATPAPTMTWATWTEAHHALTHDGFEPGAVLVLAAQEATP